MMKKKQKKEKLRKGEYPKPELGEKRPAGAEVMQPREKTTQEVINQKRGVSIRLQKTEQEMGDTKSVSVEIKAENKADALNIYDKIKDSFIPKGKC